MSGAPQKPILGVLSEDEIKKRLPQKPDELVDALNDPIHREVGRSRPGRTAKRKAPLQDLKEDEAKFLWLNESPKSQS